MTKAWHVSNATTKYKQLTTVWIVSATVNGHKPLCFRQIVSLISSTSRSSKWHPPAPRTNSPWRIDGHWSLVGVSRWLDSHNSVLHATYEYTEQTQVKYGRRCSCRWSRKPRERAGCRRWTAPSARRWLPSLRAFLRDENPPRSSAILSNELKN